MLFTDMSTDNISELAEKGIICGGTLTAGYKITVQTLGNRSFVKTIVSVGKNATMNERLNSAKTFRTSVHNDNERRMWCIFIGYS